MENIEIWKSIKGFEDLYEASNLGRIKSVERMVKGMIGLRINRERMLKPTIDFHGYCVTSLYNGKPKRVKIHQVIAIAFLNHITCGHKLVVNHIDGDKTNNKSSNLEIVTQRENANLKRFISSSKYVGVHWHKPNSKWVSRIWVNGKRKHLGYFNDEYNAYLAYQKVLNSL